MEGLFTRALRSDGSRTASDWGYESLLLIQIPNSYELYPVVPETSDWRDGVRGKVIGVTM